MATLAEYEDVILNKSNLARYIDAAELCEILHEYSDLTGEPWHSFEGSGCLCSECKEENHGTIREQQRRKRGCNVG